MSMIMLLTRNGENGEKAVLLAAELLILSSKLLHMRQVVHVLTAVLAERSTGMRSAGLSLSGLSN